jgi:hypothetical protein
MRTIKPVPLTKENFEEEYKISTGLNFITVEWIESHKPEEVSERPEFFAKLVRNIQLNLDRWVDGELNKYGRFRIFEEYPDPTAETAGTPKTYDEAVRVAKGECKPSALVQLLEEIILDGFEASYLLGNDGAYIITSDGQKILI